MRTLSRRRHGTAALLLTMVVSSSLTATMPALASGSASAAFNGWTYYANYGDHASCAAAGDANAQGRKWQCLKAARSGFDLYFWS